jgi:hypothetical protein
MSIRTIKTSNGEIFSGSLSEFREYGDYVQHYDSVSTTKIYKRGIVQDTLTNSGSDLFSALVALIVLLLILLVVMPAEEEGDGYQQTGAISRFFGNAEGEG